MTAFVLVFALVFTALQGALLAAIPTIMPPGLPLGVRVPQAHTSDPVIATAVRRFRWGLVIAWLVTAAVTLGFSLSGLAAFAVIVPVLLNICLGLLALVLSRRLITSAKREADWFAGVPVRVTAEITPVAYHHPPLIWSALAAVVLATATAVMVGIYPSLPNPIPIHYAFDGTPNGWAAKSIWSVFGVLMIGTAVVALLTGLSFVAARFSTRAQADDNAAQAALRTQVQRRLLTSLLCQLSLVIALGISAIELSQRLLPGAKWATGGSAIGMAALVLVVVVLAVARARVQLRPANARAGSSSRPDAADDDAHWKAGVFYVNRHDPSFVVPKRFGIGWTINLGHPGGAALGILLLLVVVGGVVAGVWGAHAR
jgi:uncharacterized membrane protein